MSYTPPRRSISQFRGALSGGGARPNLFEVNVSFPGVLAVAGIHSATDFANEFRFLCKSAALPASNISPIEVPFRGRSLKVAGDRTFDTWTVTVINDSNFLIRNNFETWMSAIGQHQWHSGYQNPATYQGQAEVYHLGREPAPLAGPVGLTTAPNENVIAYYKFNGIFPTNIGQIDLSYDSTDQIEEFTVEFQVQWWDRGNPTGAPLVV